MHHYRHDLIWRFGIGATLLERSAPAIPEGGVRGDGNRGTKGAMGSGRGPSLEAMERFGRIERALSRVTEDQRVVLAIAFGDLGQALTSDGVIAGHRWKAVAPLTPLAVLHAPTWERSRRVLGEQAHERRFTSELVAARARRQAALTTEAQDAEIAAMVADGQAEVADGWEARRAPPETPAEARARSYRNKAKKARTPEEVQRDETRRDPDAGPAAVRFVLALLAEKQPSIVQRAMIEAMRDQANQMIGDAEIAYVKGAGVVAHGEKQIELAQRARRVGAIR